jgi:hypothetical protein
MKNEPQRIPAASITNAEGLLGLGKLEVRAVHIKELNETIYMRQLNGDEFWQFASLGKIQGETAEYSTIQTCTAIALSVCDEKGKRLFPDAEKGALQLSHSWTFQQITETFQALADLNGLTPKALDGAAKNS